MEFPVLIEPESVPTVYGTTIFLRIPGNWSGATMRPCVIIVEGPEQCSRPVVSDSRCLSRALWKSSILERFLGFEVQRPHFARGSGLLKEAHNHSVCFYAKGTPGEVLPWEESTALPVNTSIVLGRLVYFPVPKVRFIDS